jgi:hypothetical protein
MPAVPAPALVMIQAPRALGVRIDWLHRPAAVGPLAQPLPRRVGRQGAAVPLAVTVCARYGALAEPPPLRARVDAVMAGGALGAPDGPVHAYGHALRAQDHVVVGPPGEGLPALCQQGLEDSLGLLQRRRARLLGLAAPARTRRHDQGGGAHLRGEADATGAADPHDLGDVALGEAVQQGRVVAVARVGDDPGNRHPPRPRLLHQRERQRRRRLQGDRSGHLDLGAAVTLRGPARRPLEACGEGPMARGAAGRLIRYVVGADDALAMGDLAQRPGRLAGDPDRAAPWFGQTGVVQQQHTARGALRYQGGHALLSQGLGLPGRLGSHML